MLHQQYSREAIEYYFFFFWLVESVFHTFSATLQSHFGYVSLFLCFSLRCWAALQFANSLALLYWLFFNVPYLMSRIFSRRSHMLLIECRLLIETSSVLGRQASSQQMRLFGLVI